MSVAVRRDVAILASGISAGIHGALAPQHFSEGVGAGGGFVAAVVLLTLLAVGLTCRADSKLVVAAAAVTFAGLLASYALAVTSGLPLLHPEPEPVELLALVTKTAEGGGLLAASSLLWRRPGVALTFPHPKGTLS
jgi:hypothetical protein